MQMPSKLVTDITSPMVPNTKTGFEKIQCLGMSLVSFIELSFPNLDIAQREHCLTSPCHPSQLLEARATLDDLNIPETGGIRSICDNSE